MTELTATDFLIRSVLDESFRELAIAHPQQAFEGYALSDEQRDILSHPDERLLGLLGQAIETCGGDKPHPAAAESSAATEQPRPSLPDVTLLLRLAPRAGQTPGSAGKIAYTASLHPWTGDDTTKRADAADRQEPGEATDDTPAELSWIIRITPTVVGAEASGLRVAYSPSIQPLASTNCGAPPSTRDASRAAPTSPWNHHTESSAARSAAQAVRASDPAGRYDKLLELIQALIAGDGRG